MGSEPFKQTSSGDFISHILDLLSLPLQPIEAIHFQSQQDFNQWGAATATAGYYGYGQGYGTYGYATQPQDPNMYGYGTYAGYPNYPQQVSQQPQQEPVKSSLIVDAV